MLLRHMTSAAFMFGTEELESAARDPNLKGMDLGRLRLEAEFSYSKRTAKLRQTFERTAKLLGHGFSAIIREYASAHRPETYQRYPDARSFFEYFLENWAHRPTTPAWAADVAAVELALALARTLRPGAMEDEALAGCPGEPGSTWYRAHPCALLVSCEHDVSPVFEPARSGEAVVERRVHVAVLAPRRRRHPLVMEVAPEAVGLMERSAEWTRFDPKPVPNTPVAADKALVDHLAGQGLVLVRTHDARDGNQE